MPTSSACTRRSHAGARRRLQTGNFTEELQKAETKQSETLNQRRSGTSICAAAQRRRSPLPPAEVRAAADGPSEQRWSQTVAPTLSHGAQGRC
ncbi:unnamed protein product [Tetraodon nigroviridis]|uniref:(spotted green pufferfish) hypothetical protein n=1 Tax=Tetraodon nigroviridis TaxID=99883 RepID=Q4TDB3_TETNG|nr:unnamed protein product [Tetraodon nigroviridis]